MEKSPWSLRFVYHRGSEEGRMCNDILFEQKPRMKSACNWIIFLLQWIWVIWKYKMKARIEDRVVYSPYLGTKIPLCSFYTLAKEQLNKNPDSLALVSSFQKLYIRCFTCSSNKKVVIIESTLWSLQTCNMSSSLVALLKALSICHSWIVFRGAPVRDSALMSTSASWSPFQYSRPQQFYPYDNWNQIALSIHGWWLGILSLFYPIPLNLWGRQGCTWLWRLRFFMHQRKNSIDDWKSFVCALADAWLHNGGMSTHYGWVYHRDMFSQRKKLITLHNHAWCSLRS